MAVRLLKPLASLRVTTLMQPSYAALHVSSSRLNANIINIQDSDDFTEKVINSKKPVVIDFHATWCGPCKILGPRLEKLVANNDGKLLMAKVDIDDLSELAIDHGVQAVPTVIGMKNGQIMDKFIGVKDTDELEAFVKKLMD